ncbi:MAG: YigZ family protein [Euryarchaeota archaeon]|nr:YigZ family protein [Euryarchaeota archaeon]
MDSYITVKNSVRTAMSVKKSKFIASAAHVTSEEDAKKFIAAIEKEFDDATHNPYAYVLNERSNSSDDGEPLNSAGKPILSAIENKNLINVVVVVTRYFGGTELGIGGLIRAYRDAALNAIETAGAVEKFYEEEISFSADYEFFGGLSSVLETHFCTILEQKMDKKVFFRVLVRKKDKEQFINALLKKTRGTVVIDGNE